DRVVEKAPDRVAIAFVVLGGVDPALCGDRVGSTGRIVEGEGLHVVALFAERGGGSGSGEAGSDDDDLVASAVRRVDEIAVEFVVGPLLGDGTFGDFGVELHVVPQMLTTPARTAIGNETLPMTTMPARPAARL